MQRTAMGWILVMERMELQAKGAVAERERCALEKMMRKIVVSSLYIVLLMFLWLY